MKFHLQIRGGICWKKLLKKRTKPGFIFLVITLFDENSISFVKKRYFSIVES